MRYGFQFFLKSVKTLENGRWEKTSKGSNLLSISLVCPRVGVGTIESVRKLKLAKGKTENFKNASFSEKLLFKEEIQGSSAIRVVLTAIEQPTKIEKLLKRLTEHGVGLVFGAVQGMGMEVITGLVKGNVDSIINSMTEDRLTTLGLLEWPITTELTEGELSLILSAPSNLEFWTRQFDSQGKLVYKKRKVKKGSSVAQVVVDVKKFPLD